MTLNLFGWALSFINLALGLWVYFDARKARQNGSSAYPGLVGFLYLIAGSLLGLVLAPVVFIVAYGRGLEWNLLPVIGATIIPLLIYLGVRKRLYRSVTPSNSIPKWPEYLFWIWFILSILGAIYSLVIFGTIKR